jgi:4-hydroxy-3-methylbut-2-en-1-yl diphosphate reductase
MRVIVAEEHGFCYGVRRALKRLEETIASNPGGTVFSAGEIIHNEAVVESYRARGVRTLDSLMEARGGVAVVRAHGLPDSLIARARAEGIDVVDATCPEVRRISGIIADALEGGARVFLVGEPGHPEVIASTADFGGRVEIIDHGAFDPESFRFPEKGEDIVVLSQTTMSEEVFRRVADAIASRCPATRAIDTICRSTRERQSSATALARKVDAMVVLGGKKSSNSKRLAELCSAIVRTHFVERIAELDPASLRGVSTVGLTAGASTPEEAVREAVEFLSALP